MSATTLDPMTQRQAALLRANEIRSIRAQLKQDVRAGLLSALDVMRDPPEGAANLPVGDLILSVPGVGKTKARKALRRVGISPAKPIGSLTARQIAMLNFELGGRLWYGWRDEAATTREDPR